MKWWLALLVVVAGCQREAAPEVPDEVERMRRSETSEVAIPEREEAIKGFTSPPVEDVPIAESPVVEVRDPRREGGDIAFAFVNTGSVPVTSATVEIVGKDALGNEQVLSPRAGFVCFFGDGLKPGENAEKRFLLSREVDGIAATLTISVRVLKAE